MLKLTFAAGLLSAGMALAQVPTLTVYAPDYFTSEWGPGPSIEAKFEETCDCDLVFSAGELLPRLVLEGNNTSADVVIGLNTDITKKARELGIFAPHNQDNGLLTLPIDWDDEIFLPFDWSYASFVFDTKKTKVPSSFEELVNLPNDIKTYNDNQINWFRVPKKSFINSIIHEKYDAVIDLQPKFNFFTA